MNSFTNKLLAITGVIFFQPKVTRTLHKAISVMLFSACKSKFGSIGKNYNVEHPFELVDPQFIFIGNDFSTAKGMILQTWKNGEVDPHLKIGNQVSLAYGCQISCSNSVTIGDGCLFGNNVFVTDNLHGDTTPMSLLLPPALRPIISKGPVKIGNNVWLGRNACVMPNVTIADNVIIGANAVVTKDIPANCVAAGIPARVIKEIK